MNENGAVAIRRRFFVFVIAPNSVTFREPLYRHSWENGIWASLISVG
jgi:hypothetical protein